MIRKACYTKTPVVTYFKQRLNYKPQISLDSSGNTNYTEIKIYAKLMFTRIILLTLRENVALQCEV